MLDRTTRILRFLCLLLAALLVYRAAMVFVHRNPLAGVVIPALPTLAAEKTNPPAAKAAATNAPKAVAQGTNLPAKAATTNLASATTTNASNAIIAAEKNAVQSTNSGNLSNTPVAAAQIVTNETNVAVGTNIAPAVSVATNLSTNGSNVIVAAKNGTNAPDKKAPSRGPVMAGGRPNMGGAALVELPADIKARINKIYDSEILAQAMHPMPTGLLGIAGDVAFLRAASGQTGLVKEGDALGDVKLLRIGVNRVLVEESGQKKELMIFDGYGGQSLMPQEKENQNEKAPEPKS